ncbi:hypothetical protein ACG7TL_000431 [Trametes sanguinea]
MTVVPNPAANADLPIADPTLAATEVNLNDALIGTSTVVPQGMPSSESVDNTPMTTPGATMAAESALLPPCEFRGSASNTSSSSVRLAVTPEFAFVRTSSDEDYDDDDDDDLGGGWRPKGLLNDSSKGRRKETHPTTPTTTPGQIAGNDQSTQPADGGSGGTVESESSNNTRVKSAANGKAPTKK